MKHLIEDWDTINYAVFYHDIIYSATASDNEEKSARLAMRRLNQLSYPTDKIKKCEQAILATKGHRSSDSNDTNLFIDADLSILGRPWESYSSYFKSIRKEYSIFPDLIYKPGRRKVLEHFLKMETIFKSAHFRDLYEKQARENLSNELKTLT